MITIANSVRKNIILNKLWFLCSTAFIYAIWSCAKLARTFDKHVTFTILNIRIIFFM